MIATDEAVLILGCGYTGAILAQRLGFKGCPVVGSTRTQTRAPVIRSRGAEPLIINGPDMAPIRSLRGRVGAVIYSIPPDVSRDGSWEDATDAFLSYFERDESTWPSAFVYISSTSVYGDRAGDVATEETPCHPDSPRGKARLAIEARVLKSPLRSMVVRASGIYGRGRSQLHRMASGRYRVVGSGEAITNRIHVRDLAMILEAAMYRGDKGGIYLASDARPASQQEVASYIVDTYELPSPTVLSVDEAKLRMTPSVFRMVTGSKRLDSSRTLDALGVSLRYPDYRTGLADIWRWEGPEIRALGTPDAASVI